MTARNSAAFHCAWFWRGREAALTLRGAAVSVRVFACSVHDEHVGLVIYVGHIGRRSRYVPVRIHSGCVTGDVFRSEDCDCGWQLDDAIARILATKCGLLVYLPWQEGRGHGLAAKIASLRLIAARDIDTIEAFKRLRLKQDTREYAGAVWTLRTLGVRCVELISNNPAKIAAISAGGFRVRVTATLMPRPSAAVARNLLAKNRTLGHIVRRLQ
jgi:3,4-dihydroxy 2-butanone 4-phosphate synthase/GTP cyclohydrolase II